MSSITAISEVPSSSMHRDYRLSPRCILTNRSTGSNTSLSQQVSRSEHTRQDSALSSTSNEISQYLCHPPNRKQHSRTPSLQDSPLSTTSWSFHTGQSSLEGINMERRSSDRRTRGTPPPSSRPPPPPYCGTNERHDMPKQISPSSLDLGYHTLSNDNGHYNASALWDINEMNKNHSELSNISAHSFSKNINSSSPRASSRSSSALSRSSLRKDISILPQKHNMIQSTRNASQKGDSSNEIYDRHKIRMSPASQKVLFECIEDNKRNFFDELSNELILKILSNLSTIDVCLISQVCRRFYFLAWEPMLWKSINLDGNRYKYINADHALLSLLKVLSRDPASSLSNSQNISFKQTSLVQEISIDNCSTLSDIGLLNISDKCPDLKRLEVPNCVEITNSGIQAIATLCTTLDHLNLTGCPMVSTINFERPEPTPAMAALGGVPPAPSRSLYLRHLDLTDCTRLMDEGLHVIVRNAPHLQQLFLRRCVNVTDIGVKYIASYCLGLRELSMSDCIQVTDFGLYELAKLGPNLRYLSIAKCDQVSDSGIQQMARLCYKLRYLNIRGCESISDNALNVLARSCTRLKSLDIGKCDVTDLGLKLLGEFCISLRKLSVKSCEMISDDGIKYIAYHCKGLQHINIQDCPITVEGYRTLKKFCKKCIIEHTNPGFY